jgi:excisionase family DNA binding protein
MELPEIIDEILTSLVVPLWPHAGKALGLSRGSTYAAAERGEIPTIKIGRLLRVPVRALERLLDTADRSRVETD